VWTEHDVIRLQTVAQFHKNLNPELPYDPAILLRGTCPRDMKTSDYLQLYKWMFMALTFTTVKRTNTTQMSESYKLHETEDTALKWSVVKVAQLWEYAKKKSLNLTLNGWIVWAWILSQ
jgi:hypothetical protein